MNSPYTIKLWTPTFGLSDLPAGGRDSTEGGDNSEDEQTDEQGGQGHKELCCRWNRGQWWLFIWAGCGKFLITSKKTITTTYTYILYAY